MPTEDFGVFQQLVGLDHRQKRLVVHEVVIHPLGLLWGLRPRGHAYREQPVHLGQDLRAKEVFPTPEGPESTNSSPESGMCRVYEGTPVGV